MTATMAAFVGRLSSIHAAGYLGEAYLTADRLESAAAVAQQAVDLSRKHKEQGHQAWALRLQAEIASRLGPCRLEASEIWYRQAMAVAEELEMRPLQAHCHLGLSKLYGSAAKRQEEQYHLTAATTMYRDMKMRFWLDTAEAGEREGKALLGS
jgi:hypothetical protein